MTVILSGLESIRHLLNVLSSEKLLIFKYFAFIMIKM